MSRRKKQNAPEGGSWKGAFADFCMSMMTLFMVMWIVTNGDLEKKKNLSLYFSDPGLFESVNSRHPIGVESDGMLIDSGLGGRSVHDRPEDLEVGTNGGDLFELQLMAMGDQNENINVERIPGGLKISLMESDENPMFQRSEYLLMPFFEDILLELGEKLKNTNYDLAIIGHSDATSYKQTGFLNNWTLSFARANSVREVVSFVGFPRQRIRQVSGMADTQLVDTDKPDAASNRRVELILVDAAAVEQVGDAAFLTQSMVNAWQAADRNQIQ